ncbi:MAG: glucokinase [Actinomycetota bacterium]|jgi:glucokinase|nr:glucokinase [Actinomycetota bacterium]
MTGGGAVTVGVDVGGTKCLAVALAGNRVVAEGRVATPDSGAAVLDAVAALAVEVAGDRPLAAMGAGMPGLVDRDGVLRFAPNLPGVTGLPVRDELERRLGVPVHVDNDATCAAWAERAMGAATGLDDVVLVTLGTGIGGGVITGGRLTHGANGFAGEVGHMVVDRDGPECPCGQRGCWERYASGSGLARLARLAVAEGRATAVLALAGGDPEAIWGEHVAEAAAAGDAEARALVAELGWWVGLGLANLANILDPEAFVVGGGLITMGDLLLEPVRASFAALLQGRAWRPAIPVVPAALGPRAGAIGAGCLGAELLDERAENPFRENPARRPLNR